MIELPPPPIRTMDEQVHITEALALYWRLENDAVLYHTAHDEHDNTIEFYCFPDGSELHVFHDSFAHRIGFRAFRIDTGVYYMTTVAFTDDGVELQPPLPFMESSMDDLARLHHR